MSVTALSRLLEAVDKSIRHSTEMSTILATELFQARHDAIATSKVLLENSGYELRNALINAKTLFDNKVKEFAKSNYEVIQKVSSVHVRRSRLPIHGLTFRNVPKSVDFHQTNERNSSALASTCQFVISIPRCISYRRSNSQPTSISNVTIYCLETIQSLGFIPNLDGHQSLHSGKSIHSYLRMPVIMDGEHISSG